LVFPSILKENPDLWVEGNLIHLSGRLSFKDGKGNLAEPKIIVNEAKKLEKKPSLYKGTELPVLHLRINKGASRELLNDLKSIFSLFRGESEVVLHLPESGRYRPVKITAKVNLDDNLLLKLKDLLGEDSVRVKNKVAV